MAAPLEHKLLLNVHEGLDQFGLDTYTVRDAYLYYHYGCDKFDDRVCFPLLFPRHLQKNGALVYINLARLSYANLFNIIQI